MTQTVLRKPDIHRITGFSDVTIRDMEKKGLFPRRFKLNPQGKQVGWLETEVRSWLEARGQASYAKPETSAQPRGTVGFIKAWAPGDAPPTCARCLYWAAVPGECRRHPPQYKPTEYRFPFVTSDMWCGEWHGRPKS